MRISYDKPVLYMSLWGGGKVQQYDIADPKNPKLLGEVAIPQPNMMKLTRQSASLRHELAPVVTRRQRQVRCVAHRRRTQRHEDATSAQSGLCGLAHWPRRSARHAVEVTAKPSSRTSEAPTVSRTSEAPMSSRTSEAPHCHPARAKRCVGIYCAVPVIRRRLVDPDMPYGPAG